MDVHPPQTWEVWIDFNFRMKWSKSALLAFKSWGICRRLYTLRLRKVVVVAGAKFSNQDGDIWREYSDTPPDRESKSSNMTHLHSFDVRFGMYYVTANECKWVMFDDWEIHPESYSILCIIMLYKFILSDGWESVFIARSPRIGIWTPLAPKLGPVIGPDMCWPVPNCLVVFRPTPLKNDGVKVSWDDEIPNWMESHSKFHGSSHHH